MPKTFSPGLVALAVLLVGGGATLATRLVFRRIIKKIGAPLFPKTARPTAAIDGLREQGIVYAHLANLQSWGNPNASPYSLKLETWLRMSKVPYVIVRDFRLAKAPKGKIPWIEYNGLVMGDSELIIQFLQKEFPDCEMQDSKFLSAADIAVGHTFNTLASDHLALMIGWNRNAGNFEATLKAYRGIEDLGELGLPAWLVRLIMVQPLERMTKKRLYTMGVGRHSPKEIDEIGCRDMKAISDFLGCKPFLLGDRPSTADAAVFAILASIMWVPINSFVKTYAYTEPGLENLDEYLHRMRASFWDDTIEPWYCGGDQAETMWNKLGKPNPKFSTRL
ncbi:hypothetical protein DFJ73DRAFT_815756 [Zopfochytrium polystomum]|nr:hypothetical protein DFJ73DRAFT_815756 [Zopfochytrium polystomum]